MESLIISKHIIFYCILVMQVCDVLRYITKYNLYHKYTFVCFPIQVFACVSNIILLKLLKAH